MRVVWRGLVVPGHLSGIHIHSDKSTRKEIIPFATALRRVGRCGIAGSKNVEAGLRIERSRYPGMTSAVASRFKIPPRLESRVTRVHRHGIELPLQISGLGIKRLQKTR